MTKEIKDLKVGLFQSRLGIMVRQELDCFLQFSGLRPDQIDTYNLLEDKIDPSSLSQYDAVFFGGTGDFSVHKIKQEHPETYEKIKSVFFYCKENSIPSVSICMQFPSDIFGGEVTRNDKMRELGVAQIKPTEEAKQDPLLFDVPEYYSYVGHNDSTTKLPPDAVLLASSDVCPNHVYRVGKNFYFSQNHWELDAKRFQQRLEHYREDYAKNMEEFERLMNDVRDTTVCNSLLKKFIDRVVLSK